MHLKLESKLFEQERKIAQSGMPGSFHNIEIVAQKNTKSYEVVFHRLGTSPACGMMIGNSLLSDISPMLEAGGWAVYVPYPLVWELENAEVPSSRKRFLRAQDLFALPDLIERLVNDIGHILEVS